MLEEPLRHLEDELLRGYRERNTLHVPEEVAEYLQHEQPPADDPEHGQIAAGDHLVNRVLEAQRYEHLQARSRNDHDQGNDDLATETRHNRSEPLGHLPGAGLKLRLLHHGRATATRYGAYAHAAAKATHHHRGTSSLFAARPARRPLVASPPFDRAPASAGRSPFAVPAPSYWRRNCKSWIRR